MCCTRPRRSCGGMRRPSKTWPPNRPPSSSKPPYLLVLICISLYIYMQKDQGIELGSTRLHAPFKHGGCDASSRVCLVCIRGEAAERKAKKRQSDADPSSPHREEPKPTREAAIAAAEQKAAKVVSSVRDVTASWGGDKGEGVWVLGHEAVEKGGELARRKGPITHCRCTEKTYLATSANSLGVSISWLLLEMQMSAYNDALVKHAEAVQAWQVCVAVAQYKYNERILAAARSIRGALRLLDADCECSIHRDRGRFKRRSVKCLCLCGVLSPILCLKTQPLAHSDAAAGPSVTPSAGPRGQRHTWAGQRRAVPQRPQRGE